MIREPGIEGLDEGMISSWTLYLFGVIFVIPDGPAVRIEDLMRQRTTFSIGKANLGAEKSS